MSKLVNKLSDNIQRRTVLKKMGLISASLVAGVFGFQQKASAEIWEACCCLCKLAGSGSTSGAACSWSWVCPYPPDCLFYRCTEYYSEPTYCNSNGVCINVQASRAIPAGAMHSNGTQCCVPD